MSAADPDPLERLWAQPARQPQATVPPGVLLAAYQAAGVAITPELIARCYAEIDRLLDRDLISIDAWLGQRDELELVERELDEHA